jgi:3-oxoacyl-[acyl-carrier-protein] synthase III
VSPISCAHARRVAVVESEGGLIAVTDHSVRDFVSSISSFTVMKDGKAHWDINMKISVHSIEYYLPPTVLTSNDLAAEFVDWSVDKIEAKTGIAERHIAGVDEFASDMAVKAAEKLFADGLEKEEIDALLLCTQSPDYYLPTTACLLQDRLGLQTSIAAFDFNLGCSGFVYGLGLATAMITSGQATKVLLLTADTYSKFIHPADRSVRTLFGDAATASVVEAQEGDSPISFIYGTDGSGGMNLIVPCGGLRSPRKESAEVFTDDGGNKRTLNHLYMNGPEIFNFTLRVVPETVSKLLIKSGLNLDEIDLFVFHQANRYMLEHLRKRLGIASEKFVISMQNCGNTVSCTIPIALKGAEQSGRLQRGMKVMLLGFGVGYSWAGTIMVW